MPLNCHKSSDNMMKSQLVKIVGIHLTYCLFFSSAQLPLQVKPKVRGFSGKRNNGEDGITARGALEPMYRLNNTFIPSHYDLEVRVILEDGESVGAQYTAPGKVRIVGVNQEITSSITLHAKDLAINQSSVTVSKTCMQIAKFQNIKVCKICNDLIVCCIY